MPPLAHSPGRNQCAPILRFGNFIIFQFAAPVKRRASCRWIPVQPFSAARRESRPAKLTTAVPRREASENSLCFLCLFAAIINDHEIRLYGPYVFVRMFQMRLPRLRRRRRGRGRAFRRSNHRLRRLPGASRRGGPIQSCAAAQGKSAPDRAEINHGAEPAAAARRAPMAEIQTGLPGCVLASHPPLETAGQMSEVRGFFGAGWHPVPHLGLNPESQ